MTGLSQVLRKNMTKKEKHLWYDFLKKIPLTVNRQKTLDNYIVDFFIAEVKLVIELDGSQHYSEVGRSRDERRDEHLARTGNLVLRYTNEEINRNFEGVCIDITRHIRERGMGVDWTPFKDD